MNDNRTDNRDSVGDGDLFSVASYVASPVRTRTEAQERAAELIAKRALAVGNVLTSDNAAFHVAILSALADFRVNHEFEPLYEDLREAVLGETPSPRQLDEFNADLKQIEEWKLVERRIEKMRVRGYRDNRRQKFRFRICDDAASFIEWLRARREEELNPRATATDNLLGSLKAALLEIHRTLNRVKSGSPDADAARDVMYGIQRADDLTDDVAASLQRLDKRLDDFVRAAYNVSEAHEVIEELAIFRDRFMNRIGRLRQEIVPEIDKLRAPCQLERLDRCEATFREEVGRMRHIVNGRIPAPCEVLDMLMRFYGTDGKLQELMLRVSDSARNVWKKLSARLRELERRNRRLEDVCARIAEFAQLPENEVPSAWFRELLQPASMFGDMHIRPGVKSRPPQPNLAKGGVAERTKAWIDERTDAPDTPRATSMDEARLRDLNAWLSAHGLKPSSVCEGVRLSTCSLVDDGDFRKVIELARSVILGSGARAARIGVRGTVHVGTEVELRLDERRLEFEELELTQIGDN